MLCTDDSQAVAEERRTAAGVVFYPRPPSQPGHRRATAASLAVRLAAIHGVPFESTFDPDRLYGVPLYVVPDHTLVGAEEAARLGVTSEHDLFGGAVPHAFVATKAISHPLVEGAAAVPEGWVPAFPEAMREATLFGFTAFSREDAQRAGELVLAQGPARVKPAAADGGRGQMVVTDARELAAEVAALDPEETATWGVVLEENLVADVATFSVGRLRVADLAVAYVGRQVLTRDNLGAAAYGGSTLYVVRGGFDELLDVCCAPQEERAVLKARRYDEAADLHFPSLIASRRNYDVVRGCDHRGEERCGVLEQSWRLGGASGAEILALEAFREDPELRAVRTCCIEAYGAEPDIPEEASLYFIGDDREVGPIAKYALIEARIHALP